MLLLLLVLHFAKIFAHAAVIDKLNALRASYWNASPVPRVKGNLPLNVDIMLAWLKHRDEDVGRMFVELSRTYGGTFNTRVLGEDQILSISPEVFDHVMSGGFKDFHKGEDAFWA